MINGSLLRDAIVSAAYDIQNQKQKVDELNVFPVPDGDTGTNMSMTIGASIKELELLKEPTVEETAKTAASALLRGARGNSGVILSLLFRGFANGLKCDIIHVKSNSLGKTGERRDVWRKSDWGARSCM